MMTIEYYRDKKFEWRWRLRHRNGRIMADSGEGYKRKYGAVRAWARICEEIMDDMRSVA